MPNTTNLVFTSGEAIPFQPGTSDRRFAVVHLDSQPLAHRGLRRAAELGSMRPHGDRLRYVGGCRCTDCRRANTEYERQRAAARRRGEWNGLVRAEPSRAHLARLSSRGVGRRTVGDVANVSDTVLCDIISGRKATIRANTERKILAVTEQAAADHALVDAAPTWRLVAELLADGYSKAELARRMGYRSPRLQLQKHQVTVRNAYLVARLHERLRCCSAKATLKLLAELSAEGYHRSRVQALLKALASEAGMDPPDLTVRGKERIQQIAAVLVQRLHARLTGEERHVSMDSPAACAVVKG